MATTTDSNGRKHQAAGVSGAGQFATMPKSEPAVALTQPGPAELDRLQTAREQVQERWRNARGDGWSPLVVREARDDVEVMAMHVLARDVLDQHPDATLVVLTESDQGPGEMTATAAWDADGKVLSDASYGYEDRYTAASDLRNLPQAAWRTHASELSPGPTGRRWALNVREVLASPVVLSDRETSHARGEIEGEVLSAVPDAASWRIDTYVPGDGQAPEYAELVLVRRANGQGATVSLKGTHALNELAELEAGTEEGQALPPLSGRRPTYTSARG